MGLKRDLEDLAAEDREDKDNLKRDTRALQ
jgi:hypothetical protein